MDATRESPGGGEGLGGLLVGELARFRLELRYLLAGGGRAQHGDGDADRRDREACADDEGEVVAARQRGRRRLAAGQELSRSRGRQRGQDGQAERAADLERGVDETGREAGVALSGARHGE